MESMQQGKHAARLQHINRIRKAPVAVGAQIKRIIDLLFERRQALTPEQINEGCHVDVKSNKVVFDSLRNNPKVNYDGRLFSYKSTHDIRNKDQLLSLFRKFPDGIPIRDLKDAYPTVMEDLESLQAADQIWIFPNNVAYPLDPALMAITKISSELKKLYWEIELPRDTVDIERYLEKRGTKPKKSRAAQVRDVAPTPKKEKKTREIISKRRKLTNYHLPELFQNI